MTGPAGVLPRRALVALAVLAVSLLAVGPAAAGPPAAGPSPAQRLLAEYAPVVVQRIQEQPCGPGEAFRPVSVDTVLDRPDVVLRDGSGNTTAAGPTAADLAAAPDSHHLDLPGNPLQPGCDYERWFDRVGAGRPTSVYGRVVADPGGATVVQYWFWWVFNDWNDRHEGDWEMIQLVFDAATPARALRVGPESVAFAQHEGAQVMAWDDPAVHRDGTHIAVYPSQGSHAAYFTQARWFGKSASAGFGCDDTSIGDGVAAQVLRPEVLSLSGAAPPVWLEFPGRWGQAEAAFNNGPTGPALKQQWDRPVEWMREKGRPEAVALPWLPGPAQEAFCTLTAAGSMLFVGVLDRPARTAAVLGALAVAVVLLGRRTRWRGSPRRAAAPRRAGQILMGPWRFLALMPRPLLGLAAGLASLLAGAAWLQQRAAHTGSGQDLATVGELQVSWPGVLLVAVTVAVVAAGAAVVVAAAGAVVSGVGVPRGVGAWWTLLASYLVLAGLAGTVVALPVALLLAPRWAAAPGAAVAEGLGVRAAWRRSAQLTRGRRWRSAAILLALLVLVAVPGPLIGAVLLLTPLPFGAVNLLTCAVTALSAVLAGVALMLLFQDLRSRSGTAMAADGTAGSDSLPR